MDARELSEGIVSLEREIEALKNEHKGGEWLAERLQLLQFRLDLLHRLRDRGAGSIVIPASTQKKLYAL